MKMQFKELNIPQKTVYLNIVSEGSVQTLAVATEEALTTYGDNEVIESNVPEDEKEQATVILKSLTSNI